MARIETPVRYHINLTLEDVKFLAEKGSLVRRIPLQNDIKFVDVIIAVTEGEPSFAIVIGDT